MVYNNRKNIEKSTVLSWLYFLARWKFTRFFILFLVLLFLLFIFLLTSSNITFTFLKVEDRSMIIFDKKNIQKNERYLEEHGNHGNDIPATSTDQSIHKETFHETTSIYESSYTPTLRPIESIETTEQIQSALNNDVSFRAKDSFETEDLINENEYEVLKNKNSNEEETNEEEINQSTVSMPLDNYIKGYKNKIKASTAEVDKMSITTRDSENLNITFVENTPPRTNREKTYQNTVENAPSTYKVTSEEINNREVKITSSTIKNLKRMVTNKQYSENTSELNPKDTDTDISSMNVDFVTGNNPSTILPRTTTLVRTTTLPTTTTLVRKTTLPTTTTLVRKTTLPTTTTLETPNGINLQTARKLTKEPYIKGDLSRSYSADSSNLAVKQSENSDQTNIEQDQLKTLRGRLRANPGQSSKLGLSSAQPSKTLPGQFSMQPRQMVTLSVQSSKPPGQSSTIPVQFSTQPQKSSTLSQQIENTVTFNEILCKGTPKKCKPVENVIFLKTHKTGSSTLINIFQRYAENHNLSIALPGGTSHFLGWPNTFKEEFIFEYKKGKKYNFICNHARFQKEKMLNVMKSKDTKIVTIVRDPLLQFESTAVYLHFDRLFRLSNSTNIVDAFFNKSPKYIRSIIKAYNTQSKYLAKNPNAYDMGFPTWEGRPSLEYTMTKVKRDFDLVMVSDYMAESLVLLKDLLCWDMKDIVYFTMNKRPKKYRQEIKNVEKARAQVSNWNDVDTAIFQHYNKTFWQEIEKKGEKFKEDLNLLRAMNGKLEETCLDKGEYLDKTQPWFPIEGFKLKPSSKQLPYKKLCKTMTKSEISYNNLLKKKHSTNNWPSSEKKILVTKTYNKS